MFKVYGNIGILKIEFFNFSGTGRVIERRNFSFVTHYSLKFTRCSLLVVKLLVTCCKIRSLLVAEVARYKKSLVTCCKIRSLLVREVAHSKRSLVTCCKIRSLLIAEVLVAKNHSLLITEVARFKKTLVTCCKIRSLLIA